MVPEGRDVNGPINEADFVFVDRDGLPMHENVHDGSFYLYFRQVPRILLKRI